MFLKKLYHIEMSPQKIVFLIFPSKIRNVPSKIELLNVPDFYFRNLY